MRTTRLAESQTGFTDLLDKVIRDREAMAIVHTGHEPVVIVPLAEYESLLETVHPMRSPANARRLLDAKRRLEADSRSIEPSSAPASYRLIGARGSQLNSRSNR